MEVMCSSETSVYIRTTRSYIQENDNIYAVASFAVFTFPFVILKYSYFPLDHVLFTIVWDENFAST
jgi:hypothetical protein